MTMLRRSTFLGSGTVGERGQVVIPAGARKEFNIDTGDKVLFFGHPKKAGLFIIKAEVVNDFVSKAINNAVSLEKLLASLDDNTQDDEA